MNTGLKTKTKYLPIFVKEIEKQILGGGKRYSISDNKEMTDYICELVGNDWIIGNILKYCGEYQRTKIKRDLFKIATYAFILWLRDYEIKEEEDEGEK